LPNGAHPAKSAASQTHNIVARIRIPVVAIELRDTSKTSVCDAPGLALSRLPARYGAEFVNTRRNAATMAG
jgi:hypothetical protein